MLINSLKKFLSENKDKIDSNSVYKILNNKFDVIVQAGERHEAYDIIENELNKYINGEIECLNSIDIIGTTSSSVTTSENLYIKTIDMKGIKGFINIDESIATNENDSVPREVAIESTYNNSPIINLNPNKSCLIFGWNGEGKSSITEGIEFGLTGSTAEESRRNKKSNEYLLNSNSKKGIVEIELSKPFKPPQTIKITRTIDKNSMERYISRGERTGQAFYDKIYENISWYEDYFSKHIIERNRLEEFILSKGEDKKKAYGKLLGLDELIMFIKNSLKTHNTVKRSPIFNKVGVKKSKLKSIEEQLKREEEKNFKNESYPLKQEEIEFICDLMKIQKRDIKPEKFNEISIKLHENGNVEKQIEKDINDIETIIKLIDNYSEIDNELESVSKKSDHQEDYIRLYEFYNSAKLIVNSNNKDCPLCGSNIVGEELVALVEEKLKQLSDIKTQIENIDKIKVRKENVERNILIQISRINKNINISKNDLENKERRRTLKDELIKSKDILRNKKMSFSITLQTVSEKIKEYNEGYTRFIKLKEEHESEVNKLKKQIEDIKEEVDNEKQMNNLKEKSVNDYKEFINDINEFYNNEMQEGLNGISDKIRDYYNQFEVNNPIKNIELVDNNGVQFTIKYNNKVLDPLIVLSEGQLRCFGLAILLSISDKMNCKFLILDDIVNAIDIEHRANIIKVLCKEIEKPKNKQLIITTHDKLFREKFVNSISNRNKIKTYSFLESNIVLEEDTQNILFEDKIRKAIRTTDYRTALIYMRVLIENTVYAMADGKVSLTFYNQVYKYKLEKVFFQISEVNTKVKKVYNYFVNNNRLNWTILNQENHFWSEQSIALDSQLVNEIFEYVIALSYIDQFEKLSNDDKVEIQRQLTMVRPELHRFSEESEVIDLFIDNGEWNYKFKALKRILE